MILELLKWQGEFKNYVGILIEKFEIFYTDLIYEH